MTLDAAETLQVTELAARVAAEMVRNLVRGTGGATLPMPVQRLGTVGGRANNGAECNVRADGDLSPVPAVNATGQVVEDGDRVVIEWMDRGTVRIVYQLSRASRGNWTPLIGGPSSNNATSTSVGHYTRRGHSVTAYGVWTHGASSSVGSGATLTGFPFPAISDGDGIPQILNVYYWDSSAGQRKSGMCYLIEGTSVATLFCLFSFGGTAVYEDLIPVATAAPVPWATGDQIVVTGTYDTDAA